jgi:hypothetical protein
MSHFSVELLRNFFFFLLVVHMSTKDLSSPSRVLEEVLNAWMGKLISVSRTANEVYQYLDCWRDEISSFEDDNGSASPFLDVLPKRLSMGTSGSVGDVLELLHAFHTTGSLPKGALSLRKSEMLPQYVKALTEMASWPPSGWSEFKLNPATFSLFLTALDSEETLPPSDFYRQLLSSIRENKPVVRPGVDRILVLPTHPKACQLLQTLESEFQGAGESEYLRRVAIASFMKVIWAQVDVESTTECDKSLWIALRVSLRKCHLVLRHLRDASVVVWREIAESSGLGLEKGAVFLSRLAFLMGKLHVPKSISLSMLEASSWVVFFLFRDMHLLSFAMEWVVNDVEDTTVDCQEQVVRLPLQCMAAGMMAECCSCSVEGLWRVCLGPAILKDVNSIMQHNGHREELIKCCTQWMLLSHSPGSRRAMSNMLFRAIERASLSHGAKMEAVSQVSICIAMGIQLHFANVDSVLFKNVVEEFRSIGWEELVIGSLSMDNPLAVMRHIWPSSAAISPLIQLACLVAVPLTRLVSSRGMISVLSQIKLLLTSLSTLNVIPISCGEFLCCVLEHSGLSFCESLASLGHPLVYLSICSFLASHRLPQTRISNDTDELSEMSRMMLGINEFLISEGTTSLPPLYDFIGKQDANIPLTGFACFLLQTAMICRHRGNSEGKLQVCLIRILSSIRRLPKDSDRGLEFQATLCSQMLTLCFCHNAAALASGLRNTADSVSLSINWIHHSSFSDVFAVSKGGEFPRDTHKAFLESICSRILSNFPDHLTSIIGNVPYLGISPSIRMIMGVPNDKSIVGWAACFIKSFVLLPSSKVIFDKLCQSENRGEWLVFLCFIYIQLLSVDELLPIFAGRSNRPSGTAARLVFDALDKCDNFAARQVQQSNIWPTILRGDSALAHQIALKSAGQ